jgi:hypothetical protein
MINIKLHSLGAKQMQSEIETWLRVIDFLSAENVNLKNRLSEVIQNDVSIEILEQIENYQNNFLTKDTVLALLAKDIKEFKKSLEREDLSDKDSVNRLFSIQNKLRDDVGKTEREFINIRSGFNKFLLGILK